jgi:hypothetical protein
MKTDELWFCKNTKKQSAAETALKYMGKRFYVFMKLYNFYLCRAVAIGEVKNALF